MQVHLRGCWPDTLLCFRFGERIQPIDLALDIGEWRGIGYRAAAEVAAIPEREVKKKRRYINDRVNGINGIGGRISVTFES